MTAEEKREYDRKWRAANPDKVRVSREKYYKKNYFIKNKNKLKNP